MRIIGIFAERIDVVTIKRIAFSMKTRCLCGMGKKSVILMQGTI